MEPETGADQPRLEMSLAQGCRLFLIIFYLLILFFLIACIMILLIALNRSGRFALLSTFFGALLYCALTLPKALYSMRQASLAQRHARGSVARMSRRIMARRPTTARGVLAGLLLFILLGLATFIGLYFLPGQGLVFALISGVLALAFLFSLLEVIGLVFSFFLIRRRRARNASIEAHDTLP